MKVPKRSHLIMIGALLLGLGVFVFYEGPIDYPIRVRSAENKTYEDYDLSGRLLNVPFDVFTLVKQDQKYCAIAVHETGTTDSGNYRYTKYDWYYTETPSAPFTMYKYGSSKAISHYVPFIGRFDIIGKYVGIKCGKIKIEYAGGAALAYTDRGSATETTEEISTRLGYQYAPTRWGRIEQVNFLDPKLKWYGYDPNRKSLIIKLSDLPE